MVNVQQIKKKKEKRREREKERLKMRQPENEYSVGGKMPYSILHMVQMGFAARDGEFIQWLNSRTCKIRVRNIPSKIKYYHQPHTKQLLAL